MAEIGENLPNFTLPRDGGELLSKADFAGKKLVLFFYPRDDTSGCTKESIEFSQQLAAFEDAGAKVVGVSADSVKSHDKFVSKHNLAVPLLSDEDTGFLQAVGVWKEKNMYGRKFMGIDRTTFLVDQTGVVAQRWNKVKVPGHVDDVLAAVQAL